MAASPISQLPGGALTGANVDVDNDKLAIDDVSAGVTKHITPKELVANTSSFVQSGSGVAWPVQNRLNECLHLMGALSAAKRLTVIAGTATDVTTELQTLITEAAGRPIILPGYGGNLIVTSQLSHALTANTKNAGLILIGQGREKTIFDNRVANNAMLKLDTGTNSKHQWGGYLKGFQIKTTTSPASSDGTYIRRQQALTLEDIYITGLTGDGVEIELASGDADSTTGLTFRHCWIASCAGWGINCNLAAGLNELSFLEMDNTRIESCGTSSGATPPPSGGMKWKGQGLHMYGGTAFVTNENIGFYIVGGTGASNTLRADCVTFENNKTKHLLIATLLNGQFIGTQFYSNESFITTHGADLTVAGGGSIVKVKFQGSIVRATDGNNPHTQWTVGSGVLDCAVEDTHWDDYDAAGQTRFNVASNTIGFRRIDDGVATFGTAVGTNASRGDLVITNNRGMRGLNSNGDNTFSLIKIDANDFLQVASTSIRTFFAGFTHIRVVATGDLPAGATAMDGCILIEDGGAGNRNIVIYAGGERFRIDGGATF